MEKSNIIIGALYDDGVGSGHKNADLFQQADIYSFGRNDNEGDNYGMIDLSCTNENLMDELIEIAESFGGPDVIVAHPPCESGSIADNQRRIYRNIEGKFKEATITFMTPPGLTEKNQSAIQNGHHHLIRKYEKQFGRFLNGLGTATATIEIIKRFVPKVGIIENPQSSKIGEYLSAMSFLGDKHITYYNKWDKHYTPKPTCFLSNIDLSFPKETTKYEPNGKTLAYARKHSKPMDYDMKSAVPKSLIEFLYGRCVSHIEEMKDEEN